MNLVIDQGNTVTKVALFDNEALKVLDFFETFDLKICEKLLAENQIDRCLYCSVVNTDKKVLSTLEQRIPGFIFMNNELNLPVINFYRTPDSLGSDRIAAAVGAHMIFPNKNILIIDIGTAITYDFVDSEGIYIGGNISPGIRQRFNALHHFTDKLPLVDRHGEIPEIGYDTETAIRSGVIKGTVYELDSYINDYKLRYSNIEVILTGGHSKYIQSELKNNIFVEPNLVLKGLNRILNYNVNE